MALIKANSAERLMKSRNNIHKEVHWTYTDFKVNGKKYFQIDTYGSNDREMKGKTSQSFQIDKEAAKLLIDVLKREFEL
jgi:hypothetical protein